MLQCKLNEDTMAKKQKSPEKNDQTSYSCQDPTPQLDSAAARLVKMVIGVPKYTKEVRNRFNFPSMIQSTADFLPVWPESGHLGSSILYFHPPTITKRRKAPGYY